MKKDKFYYWVDTIEQSIFRATKNDCLAKKELAAFASIWKAAEKQLFLKKQRNKYEKNKAIDFIID